MKFLSHVYCRRNESEYFSSDLRGISCFTELNIREVPALLVVESFEIFLRAFANVQKCELRVL